MPAASWELGMDVVELKAQRASRRATSLSKDRAEYKKQSLSCEQINGKLSAAPVGSSFARPHRVARASTRTCLAKGLIDSSSDMPQISMGRAGAWTRWIRKPSVSTSLNEPTFTQERTVELAAEEQQRILSEVEEEGRSMLEVVRFRAVETAKSIASEQVGTDKANIWNAAVSALNAACEGENANEVVSGYGDMVDHGKGQTNADCAIPFGPVSAACFDEDLLDERAFPRLAAPQQKLETHNVLQVMTSDPSEFSSGVTKSESEGELPLKHVEAYKAETRFDPALGKLVTSKQMVRMYAARGQTVGKGHWDSLQTTELAKNAAEDELLEDWIMLPCDDSTETALTARGESLDDRHPRHVLANQGTAKREKSKADAWELDWSQAGIPREIKRQLIHGSSDASHRSIHANKQSVPLPLRALRQQSIGSSRRQNSTPRTPRSQSKPRMIQQPAKRR